LALGLVGISYPWIETTSLAKTILLKLIQNSELLEVTSLFKRRSQSGSDFESTIEMVAAVSTEKAKVEFASRLHEIAKEIIKRREDSQVSIKLLLYDQEVIMTPELTLPHPDLQYDLLTLRLSSEVWSRYEHPVLKKTLRELSDLRGQELDVEFVMQAKNLFD
jgi:7,8-dihydro-6-hydroxymethylpterin-pyrophosphokinase